MVRFSSLGFSNEPFFQARTKASILITWISGSRKTVTLIKTRGSIRIKLKISDGGRSDSTAGCRGRPTTSKGRVCWCWVLVPEDQASDMGTYIQHVKVRKVYLFKKRKKKLKKEKKCEADTKHARTLATQVDSCNAVQLFRLL